MPLHFKRYKLMGREGEMKLKRNSKNNYRKRTNYPNWDKRHGRLGRQWSKTGDTIEDRKEDTSGTVVCSVDRYNFFVKKLWNGNNSYCQPCVRGRSDHLWWTDRCDSWRRSCRPKEWLTITLEKIPGFSLGSVMVTWGRDTFSNPAEDVKCVCWVDFPLSISLSWVVNTMVWHLVQYDDYWQH